jgi:hypothetical protein
VIPAPINFRQDAFHAVPEVFQHLADAPLVIEAHDDEVAPKAVIL